MNQVIFPFTLTAAYLNGSDTGDQALTLTWPTNSQVIRVPRRLELTRNAGTAYTLGSASPSFREDKLRQAGNYADFFSGGKFLVFRDDGEGNYGTYGYRAFFYVPMENFLDQASSKSVVVFPYLDGQTFKPGATSYKIHTTCSISGGTGTLSGVLYFDEYPVPGV